MRGTNGNSQQTTKREQGHKSILTATNRPKDDTACILEWDSPLGYVPLSEEESMVEFMFRRNGKRERGMLKGKPSYVVSKYRKAMQQHAPTMNFPQLLSLRRHHIKLFNEHRNMTQLGLGDRDDINKSAKIFEWAIEKFLKNVSIDFLTEEQQREEAAKEGGVLQATPDFILPKPTVLRKVHKKKIKKKKQCRVLEERTIHWIEAKMFYGASSIPHGSKGAVGTVLARAQKYVDNFGEGAIIFMMGCGDKLAAELNDIGVSVLDCSGNTVSLDSVHDHQRMWCADEKGRILP